MKLHSKATIPMIIAIVLVLAIGGFASPSSYQNDVRTDFLCEYDHHEIASLTREQAVEILQALHQDVCIAQPMHDGDNFSYSEHEQDEIHIDYLSTTHDGDQADSSYGRQQLEDQRKDLISFFQLIGGLKWTVKTNWGLQGAPLCTWFGINCDGQCTTKTMKEDKCPVTGIELGSNNLEGDISAAMQIIERFQLLEYLDLSSNLLRGDFPNITLPSLTSLNLQYNDISGTLHDFQGMPRLDALWIDGIPIKGTIPDFTGFPLLTSIWIGSPLVDGNIPSFQHVPNLMIVGIQCNGITGPLPEFQNNYYVYMIFISGDFISGTLPDYKELMILTELDLSSNKFTGTIPNYPKLSNLETLGIAGVGLSGTLPNFDFLVNLKSISLWDTSLSGNIPKFEKLALLESLHMNGNSLRGTVHDFSHNPLLSKISLNQNELQGTLPAFSSLPLLRNIQAWINNFIGDAPNLSNHTILEYIDFSLNQFNGTIPSMNGLPNLSTLYLNRCNMSGTIPNLEGLTRLKFIDLSTNRLRGTLPDFEMLYIEHIELSENQLSGPIPNFCCIPNLVYLYVNGNQLSGSLPDFSSLKKMRDINLSRNNFTGSVPNFTNLQRLWYLDIALNKLSGQLPNFGALRSIWDFVAYANNFEGSVPLFPNSTLLMTVRLQDNRLSGGIPAWPSNILETVDLSYNQLDGSIESAFALRSPKKLDLSYNFFEGTIAEVDPKSVSFIFLDISNNLLRGLLPSSVLQVETLISLDASSNQLSGDIKDVFNTNPNTSALYINLDNNQFTGALDWWTFYSFPQIFEITIRNNKMSKIDDVYEPISWRRLDLSGNPITGKIPDSFRFFTELQYMNLQNTSLHHGSSTLLPNYARYTDPYNLKDKFQLYICPSIKAELRTVETNIEIEPSYYNMTFCRCLPNYFGFAGRCVLCPSECDCSDGLVLKRCHASPSVENITHIQTCPQPSACDADIPVTSSLDYESLPITNLCQNGYTERACSRCEQGFGQNGRTCRKCDSASRNVSVVIGVLSFLSFILYLYKSSSSSSAGFRITMFHAQTLSILASIITTSPAMGEMVDWSFSVGSMQMPNLACVLDSTNMIDRLIFSVARVPFICASALFLYLFFSHARDKIVYVLLSVLYFFFYGISRDVFDALGCTVWDEGSETWYLNAAPWISCDPSVAEHKQMLAVAIPTILLYVFGLPCATYIALRMRKASNTSHEKRIGFLYLSYTEERYYWELVVISRRLAFSFVTSVIPYTQPSILYFALVVVIQMSIWLQHKFQPYREKTHNRMELASLYVIFASFFLSLLASFLRRESWITGIVIAINGLTLAVFAFIVLLRPLWARITRPKATVVANVEWASTQPAADA
eukprot:TRINITY_DN449_c0_g2_i2.p1 TRINITY_DN449_c0_g2~~TRINITY_DN449_c0_g2_i2.p1  ORF type:complete len:1361 (+),score=255.84 TRINITY_DN449_c0_g2_i2:49-4131(+)